VGCYRGHERQADESRTVTVSGDILLPESAPAAGTPAPTPAGQVALAAAQALAKKAAAAAAATLRAGECQRSCRS
jgi:hypothetical protein